MQENEENVFLSETSDRSSVQECRRWVDVGRFSPASAKAAGLQPPAAPPPTWGWGLLLEEIARGLEVEQP